MSPVPSGLGVWASAAGWVGGAAGLTADLQGRVLTLGYLAGAESHGCVILGLEELDVLQSVERFRGDLLYTLQKIVVLTRVRRQVVEQWGLMSGQKVGSMTGRICSGVAVGGAWGGAGSAFYTRGRGQSSWWGWSAAGLERGSQEEKRGTLGEEMSLVFPIPNSKDSTGLIWVGRVEEDRLPWALKEKLG